MSGRKRIPMAGEKFPIPVSGLDDLEGAQALEDFFEPGDGEASHHLRAADEEQDPGDRPAGFRDEQDRAQAYQEVSEKILRDVQSERDLEPGRSFLENH